MAQRKRERDVRAHGLGDHHRRRIDSCTHVLDKAVVPVNSHVRRNRAETRQVERLRLEMRRQPLDDGPPECRGARRAGHKDYARRPLDLRRHCLTPGKLGKSRLVMLPPALTVSNRLNC